MEPDRLLGTIRNISTGWTEKDLFVFSRAFVITEHGPASMLIRVIGMEFGLIGALLTSGWLKRREAAWVKATAGKSPEELAARHQNNRLLPVQSIVDARLRKSFLKATLELSMADGAHFKFQWSRGQNDLRGGGRAAPERARPAADGPSGRLTSDRQAGNFPACVRVSPSDEVTSDCRGVDAAGTGSAAVGLWLGHRRDGLPFGVGVASGVLRPPGEQPSLLDA